MEWRAAASYGTGIAGFLAVVGTGAAVVVLLTAPRGEVAPQKPAAFLVDAAALPPAAPPDAGRVTAAPVPVPSVPQAGRPSPRPWRLRPRWRRPRPCGRARPCGLSRRRSAGIPPGRRATAPPSNHPSPNAAGRGPFRPPSRRWRRLRPSR